MKEDSLIFLISQPRSGSTLLQKILMTHSEISSASEPWIMLHPFYALREHGIDTEYNSKVAYEATNSFIGQLTQKEQTYRDEIGKMMLNLYSDFNRNNSGKYFLDKTPRYYLILNDLLQTYPKAKYLILLRNPLAVLSSILNTWIKGNYGRLSIYSIDLRLGIKVLSNICRNNDHSVLILHYEDLLNNSEEFLKNVFKYLNLDYEKDIIEKSFRDKTKWALGDQKIYSTNKINKENHSVWQKNLNDPQIWRFLYDYLVYEIGEEKYNLLGYNYQKDLEILKKNPPIKYEEIFLKTLPLERFLKEYKNM
jgi:hypothetical protein